MNVLVVDDEPGIREGIAHLARMRGHVVRTAASLDEALAATERERFDAIVTDWRLGDGVDAAALCARAECPCVVVSGSPDDVRLDLATDRVAILAKPVAPATLFETLDRLASARVAETDGRAPEGGAAGAAGRLPLDAAARVELVLAAVGVAIDDRDRYALVIDDEHVALRVPCAADRDDMDWLGDLLEQLGGDFRFLPDALEVRWYTDGRPAVDDGVVAVPVGDPVPWTEDASPLTLDFSLGVPSPREFLALLDSATAARERGRDVWFVNLPDHLRLCAEVSGRAAEIPMRPVVGPILPPVLEALWR